MRGTLELIGMFVIVVLSLSLVEAEKRDRTKGQTILAMQTLELNKVTDKVVNHVSELEARVRELEALRVHLTKLLDKAREREEASQRLNQAIEEAPPTIQNALQEIRK